MLGSGFPLTVIVLSLASSTALHYSACRGRRRRAGKRKQTSFVDYNPLSPQDFQDSSAGASTVSLVDVRIRYQILVYNLI